MVSISEQQYAPAWRLDTLDRPFKPVYYLFFSLLLEALTFRGVIALSTTRRVPQRTPDGHVSGRVDPAASSELNELDVSDHLFATA